MTEKKLKLKFNEITLDLINKFIHKNENIYTEKIKNLKEARNRYIKNINKMNNLFYDNKKESFEKVQKIIKSYENNDIIPNLNKHYNYFKNDRKHISSPKIKLFLSKPNNENNKNNGVYTKTPKILKNAGENVFLTIQPEVKNYVKRKKKFFNFKSEIFKNEDLYLINSNNNKRVNFSTDSNNTNNNYKDDYLLKISNHRKLLKNQLILRNKMIYPSNHLRIKSTVKTKPTIDKVSSSNILLTLHNNLIKKKISEDENFMQLIKID